MGGKSDISAGNVQHTPKLLHAPRNVFAYVCVGGFLAVCDDFMVFVQARLHVLTWHKPQQQSFHPQISQKQLNENC